MCGGPGSTAAQQLAQTKAWLEQAIQQKQTKKLPSLFGIDSDRSPLLLNLPKNWTNKQTVERLFQSRNFAETGGTGEGADSGVDGNSPEPPG